jgi:hypothetical protein
MTDRPDTLLTLIAPAALEENLVDLLLAAPGLALGFTTSAADGHGGEIALVTVNERVRGRGRRVRIEVAMSGGALAFLLDQLRAALPHANVFFWVTSLLDCGRLS